MASSREKINQKLVALDAGMVNLRAQGKSPRAILARFREQAAPIEQEAGDDGRYVSNRLRSILFANGLSELHGLPMPAHLAPPSRRVLSLMRSALALPLHLVRW